MSARLHLSALALLSASSFLPACGEVVDYQLSIEPIFAENQKEAISAVSKWRLVLEYPQQNPETFDLDFGRNGYATVPDLPSLPEGTTIAVEGLGVNGGAETLLAFGRSQPLSVKDHQDVSVQVLIALVDAFFTLNNETITWGSTLAPSGTGDFYAFGGYSKGFNANSSPLDSILQLRVADPDTENLSFQQVGTLPATRSGMTGRRDVTATLLTSGDHAHVGQILVTGGWERYLRTDPTYEAFYFDPETWLSEPVTDGSGNPSGLHNARAAHRAIELPGGKVVIFGGYTGGASTGTSAEVFDPATNTVVTTDDVGFAATLGDAAVLGDRGAIYCGGIDSMMSNWHSTGSCVTVNSAGGITKGSLPAEARTLILPALAPLDGNRVLVTGGFQSVSGDTYGVLTDTATATDQVWMYSTSGTEWTPMAPMTQARGYHRAVTLPDGRVLVVGGATELDGVASGAITALPCAEVLDPEANGGTGEWTPIGTCDANASAGVLPGPMADPSAAVDDNYGAVFLGGVNSEGESNAFATLYIGQPGW